MDNIQQKIQDLEKEISFLKRANKGIRNSLEEISLLQHMFKGISSARTKKLIISQFMTIIESYWCNMGFVSYSLDLENLEFLADQHQGIDDDFIKENYDINTSILTWILNEKQISSIPPSNDNTDYSLVLIPLYTVTKLLGVLAIQVKGSADSLLTQHILEILSIASGYAATSIENSLLYEDIFKQKQNLEKEQAFSSNIIESLVNGIITIDQKGIVTHINRNALVMFGLDSPPNEHDHYKDFFPSSLGDLITLLFDQTRENGFVMDYQVDFDLPGGVKIPYGVSTSLLRDSANTIIGMVMIARDLTATRELARLRDLDKLKNDFVSTVSHELRSPLATIRAYIDTLIHRVDPDDTENRTMFLQTIEQEANRLSSLVDNMLDIARIESGRIQLELEYMNIDDVIHSVADLCQMQSTKHNINIDITGDLPKLNLDRDRITQVLYNIVNNAIKYAPEGGDINITAFEKDASVRVSVKDHGLGITEEDLKHLFEKFYRVNSQQTSDIGGTGLGLAIVKKLVELHGGKVDIESVYGEGSTFTIILPTN